MTVLQTINTMAAGMGTIMAQALHSGWRLAMIARASVVGIDYILFSSSIASRVPDGTSISPFAMRLRGSPRGALLCCNATEMIEFHILVMQLNQESTS